jgi:hypothetical protein
MVGYRSLVISSPLPPEDVERRLQAKIDRTGRWSIFTPPTTGFDGPNALSSPNAVSGNVKNGELWLRRRFSKNQTWLFADVAADKDRTKLRVVVGTHPFVIAFMAFWLAFLLSGAIQIWSNPSESNATLTYIFSIVIFGLACEVQARFLGRGDERFLVDFLRQTIDA